jgi:hypothetical protein
MRDQFHYVSGFQERRRLGRNLPGSKRTLLGDPRENGGALPPAAGLGFAPDEANSGGPPTLSISPAIPMFWLPPMPKSSWIPLRLSAAVAGQNPFFPTKAQIANQNGIEILGQSTHTSRFPISIISC